MFRSTRMWFVFAVALIAAIALVGSPVHAASNTIIQVAPGNKAIRKALKKANPGDVLNIHAGTYNEFVTVKKANVTLQAAGDGAAIIDAQCSAQDTIELGAEGITIKGLTIKGAEEYSIDIEHLNRAFIRNNTLLGTCSGVEYGVNVFDGGTLQVIGNTASGFSDAGIYIGGINVTPDGPLIVKNNETFNNTRGIIVEDSSVVKIEVKHNNTHDNSTTGILIHNSDGIKVLKNTVKDDNESGIHLDSPSDNNIVKDNTISGHTSDIWNEGSGNCFANNTYTTSSGPVDECL